ncbi:MAG: hypothetical protein P9M07_05880 [Candidatus Aceula meridiana]|nr:hypothetical protein [Candidatus Aceula meridiana]
MRKLIIILMCLFFVGCASVPKALPMKREMLPNFRVSSEIAIKNVSEDKELKPWTNSIVEFLSSELKKRGAIITDNAQIVLKVDLTKRDQNQFYAYWATKCTISFFVETGDGYKRFLETYDVSGDIQRACDFSITKGVAAILTDSRILEYIKAEKVSY